MSRLFTMSFACAFGALSIATTTQAATIQIDLNYNFNGIAHIGELTQPDAPNGYRSISDRGLNFAFGIPNHPVLNKYKVVQDPFVLDIVHLGNRDTVDNGNHFFDDEANGDNRGTKPDWLPNVDQTGPQTTVLSTPIRLDGNSSAGILFQISNGGGDFDVTFTFQGGASHTARLTGPDWFGPFNGQPNIGAFPGVGSVDMANPAETLLLTEQIVDLSSFAGQTLTEITFSNRSNLIAGYAVIAANVEGTLVPEPASLTFMGVAGVILLRRRR